MICVKKNNPRRIILNLAFDRCDFDDMYRPSGVKGQDQWFDPRAFQMPTAGTFGNVSRGSLRGPRLVNVDTSLFKKFTINERWNLQFRAEAFNVFNHATFSHPQQVVFSGNTISPSAGVITQTATTSRQLQFALKLLF